MVLTQAAESNIVRPRIEVGILDVQARLPSAGFVALDRLTVADRALRLMVLLREIRIASPLLFRQVIRGPLIWSDWRSLSRLWLFDSMCWELQDVVVAVTF